MCFSPSLPGERLADTEVDEVLKDCLDPEDDDGMVPYVREYRYPFPVVCLDRSEARRSFFMLIAPSW